MIVECKNCFKTFEKCDYQIRKTKNNFCSRSCSATFTNKFYKKREAKIRNCNLCNGVLSKEERRNKFCKSCRIDKNDETKNRTIKEEREKILKSGKHPSWLHSNIRNLNRSWNKELTLKPCFICGYDKHVELAHIKPISSFSDESTLAEVNCSLNVVQLCPNCHWEFDNNLINIKEKTTQLT